MSPHLTAMLAGGGQLLAPGSSTGDTGFSFTQDSCECCRKVQKILVCKYTVSNIKSVWPVGVCCWGQPPVPQGGCIHRVFWGKGKLFHGDLLVLTRLLCVCMGDRTGTDVMLLESFSTDGFSHHQQSNNLTGWRRRSSVTFEDQVEHSKGACLFLTPLQTPQSSWSPGDLYKSLHVCCQVWWRQPTLFVSVVLSWKQQPDLGSNPRRGAQVPGRLCVFFGEGHRERRQADSVWGGPEPRWRRLQQQGCAQTQVPGRPEAEAGKHRRGDCERRQRWSGGGWGGKTSLTTAGPERFIQLRGFPTSTTGTPYLNVLAKRSLTHFHSSE